MFVPTVHVHGSKKRMFWETNQRSAKNQWMHQLYNHMASQGGKLTPVPHSVISAHVSVIGLCQPQQRVEVTLCSAQSVAGDRLKV